MNIERIRMLAKAERMMDSGEVPWVWSMNHYGQYERLSVTPDVMRILELEQGQTVNAFIVDAISTLSLMILKQKIEEVKQEMEDSLLTEDFDFRSMM